MFYSIIDTINVHTIGRQHRKDIDLNLKPFRGNNNINNYIFHTKKNVQFKTSNKYLLLLLLLLYTQTVKQCIHTHTHTYTHAHTHTYTHTHTNTLTPTHTHTHTHTHIQIHSRPHTHIHTHTHTTHTLTPTYTTRPHTHTRTHAQLNKLYTDHRGVLTATTSSGRRRGRRWRSHELLHLVDPDLEVKVLLLHRGQNLRVVFDRVDAERHLRTGRHL